MSEAGSAETIEVTPAQASEQAQPGTNRVLELQVSAHLMTLDIGLFCVFQAAGSPSPDPATGLPGVRITPAPGMAGRPEAVSVSTFREDGWLNGTAALVRVTDGNAQVLVTIYQHKGIDAAPRLQVLRLNGEPNTAAPRAVATAPQIGAKTPQPAVSGPPAAVMAHVQRMGDVGCQFGQWLGVKGSGQWIEGVGISPQNGIALEDIEYQAVLGRDWMSPWVEGGKFCGSRGMALPLLGIKVRLKGAAAKSYTCSYSATFTDGSAVGPVSNGEACQAESFAALEALQIVLTPLAVRPALARDASARGLSAKTPSRSRLSR